MTKFHVLSMAFFLLWMTGCEEDQILAQVELPQQIQSFVSTHFPGKTILQAEKDKEFLDSEFHITLSDLTSLEFNRKGEIIDINGLTALPESVIPTKLANYVQSNFPDQFILGWELDGRRQDLKLNTGVELEFTLNGDFLRID
jgi:hypothetical protein